MATTSQTPQAIAQSPVSGFLPGSNQYGSGGGMSWPGNFSMPAPYFNNPYQVPDYPGMTSGGIPGYGLSGYGAAGPQWLGTPGHSSNLGHGIIATGLQYPGLSENFANYLMSQIGAGMMPFDLSTMLPTGGMSQPGQLTAGENPLLQQLQNFFMGGSTNIPGLSTMGTIASQGISALPEWQSMIKAQQQNIQQNQANLAEQFGSMGNLAGSPFGTAMSNYMSQTTADQNALLGQLQQQNILQGQIPLIEQMFGGAQQMAGGLQALDQQAIQNQYQEFQRVQPQNNPMLQYIMGLSTLYPPTTKTATGFDQFTSLLSSLGGSGFSTGGSGGSGAGTAISF